MNENKILTEDDMPKHVLEEIERQEEMTAEVRRVYHDGVTSIHMEVFHAGKAVANVGVTVDGNVFNYVNPQWPKSMPVKVLFK